MVAGFHCVRHRFEKSDIDRLGMMEYSPASSLDESHSQRDREVVSVNFCSRCNQDCKQPRGESASGARSNTCLCGPRRRTLARRLTVASESRGLIVKVGRPTQDAEAAHRPIAPGKDASPPPPWDPWLPGAFFCAKVKPQRTRRTRRLSAYTASSAFLNFFETRVCTWLEDHSRDYQDQHDRTHERLA